MSDLRHYSREFMTEFIELYKSYPCLWKTKCKDYMNRTKKDAAYETLLKKLREVEPNSTKKNVKVKINRIRGSFRREMKKIEESKRSGAGTDEIYVTHLWYYDLLLFCKDQEVPRTSVSNIDSQESEHESDQVNEDEGEEAEDLEDVMDRESITIPSPTPTTRSSTTTYGTTIGRSAAPTSSTASKKSSKKKKSNVDQQVDDVLNMVGDRLRTNATGNDDPCNIFGKNVGAKLRTLPKETRLYTEKLINELLFEAEMGNINKNTRIVMSSDEPRNQNNKIFQSSTTNNTGFNQPSQYHTCVQQNDYLQLSNSSLAYPREPQLEELQPRSHIYQLHSGTIATQVSPEPQLENASSFFQSYQPNND